MEITVELYKPSGKWYDDVDLQLPKSIPPYSMLEYVAEHFYSPTEYRWILVVHPKVQRTQESSDFVGFPQMVRLENFWEDKQ